MKFNERDHRKILTDIAYRAMLEHGFLPDFSPAILSELERLPSSMEFQDEKVRDLCSLPWCSIDNDDSLDLDQLTVVEQLPGSLVKVRVAIADVDLLVKNGSAIDEHARHNTTSIYTAAVIFPMLPEILSTNLTSLNFNQERHSIVVEYVVNDIGEVQDIEVYQARVRNQAKLAYNSVAAWLEGQVGVPEEVTLINGLEQNLRLQDLTAQKMKKLRQKQGALSLETIEAKPVYIGEQLQSLEPDEKNRAKEIIENFMIAANGVTARFLASRKLPSIRRVVRVPKNWDRIVEIAALNNFKLPRQADSQMLEEFLIQQKARDPLRFPDLSLAVIKLLGNGEYIAELPGDTPPGHFGLAVKDYSHSTAPNRRFSDLLTQRLLKSAMQGKLSPYSFDELQTLAVHCTKAEDAANKVERQVGKSAAALLLEGRIGEQFDAFVTGHSQKGTWVRLMTIPVEGKLVSGYEKVDVGDQVRVRLIMAEVERGFIDFKRVGFGRN